MLGLLGLRIFEATSAKIADLGEEHGHRVLRVCGKGTKVVQVPLPPASCNAPVSSDPPNQTQHGHLSSSGYVRLQVGRFGRYD
jgi:integrase